MSRLPVDYINLTDRETLYALRCLAASETKVFHPSSARLGIAKRALKSLAADGLVLEDWPGNDMWLLTENGRRVVDLAGGFKYG